MDVKDLIPSVISHLDSAKVSLEGFKGSWLDVVKNIPKVIIAVEKVGEDFLISGIDKKSLAMEVLNQIIKIKWMPGFIKTAIIEIIIEGMVAAYNTIGHKWLEKIGEI